MHTRYLPPSLILNLLFAMTSAAPAQEYLGPDGDAPTVQAAGSNTVPTTISYQGLLTDDGGVPLDGSVNLDFSLYTVPSEGTAVWTEAHTGVSVNGGVFDVLLGGNTSLSSVDFNTALWLGTRVNGSAELAPRTAMASVPYALGLKLPFSGSGQADGASGVLELENTGSGHGLKIIDSGTAGVRVENAGLSGVYVFKSGDSGFEVKDAGTPSNGASSGDNNGFDVGGAEGHGLYVGHADLNGVNVNSTDGYGLHVLIGGDDGINLNTVGGDGLHVQNAGGDGVHVENPTADGVRVDGAGGYSLHIRGSKNESGPITGHVAQIYNLNTGDSPDVLALKVGTAGNPGGGVNFLTFYHGNTNTAVGSVEGNGSGGVSFATGGADYAEYLPVSDSNEPFEKGDLVGVFDGRITLRTSGADQVMVLTDRPAVLGNVPADDATEDYETVSFLGQVAAKVLGPVTAGDYIVASGLDDGNGRAVPPEEITISDLKSLVGRAWETSSDAGLKRVTVVVGLDRSEVLEYILDRQQREIDILREQVMALLRPEPTG